MRHIIRNQGLDGCLSVRYLSSDFVGLSRPLFSLFSSLVKGEVCWQVFQGEIETALGSVFMDFVVKRAVIVSVKLKPLKRTVGQSFLVVRTYALCDLLSGSLPSFWGCLKLSFKVQGFERAAACS